MSPVAREWIPAGAALSRGEDILQTAEPIRPGHKLALKAISKDAPVRKYGHVIGFASHEIAPGAHVHSHNLEARDFDRDYRFGEDAVPLQPYPPGKARTFDGYLRSDGRVGNAQLHRRHLHRELLRQRLPLCVARIFRRAA